MGQKLQNNHEKSCISEKKAFYANLLIRNLENRVKLTGKLNLSRELEKKQPDSQHTHTHRVSNVITPRAHVPSVN